MIFTSTYFNTENLCIVGINFGKTTGCHLVIEIKKFFFLLRKIIN